MKHAINLQNNLHLLSSHMNAVSFNILICYWNVEKDEDMANDVTQAIGCNHIAFTRKNENEKTITHLPSGLPEIELNNNFIFEFFYSKVKEESEHARRKHIFGRFMKPCF